MLNRCLSALKGPFAAAIVVLACALARPALAQPVQADFNGDGYSDVAIGAPGDYEGGSAASRSGIRCGTVTVMYGSASGLASPGNCSPQGGVPPAAPCAQVWDQGIPGLVGQGPTDGYYFGYSLAAADFNADGYADLAAGSLNGDTVAVLYGSASGLQVTGNQEWSLNSPGIIGDPSGLSSFGQSLTVGDFNSDGFGDLAVGDKLEPDGSPPGSYGAVHALYGSASGLSSSGNECWTKTKQYFGSPGSHFGDSLAAGDFNGDGATDLAIHDGNPVNPVPTGTYGAVHFLYGSVVGLNLSNPRYFDAGSPGIDDGGFAIETFGETLTGGDFNGDGYVDLAVGSSGGGGRVNVLHGSAFGLDSVGSQVWHQDLPGVDGTQSGGGMFFGFGEGLAAGDFNADGFLDLAVGDPDEDINGLTLAGSVNIFLGSATGLVNNAWWHQDSPGILDDPETPDGFGWSLAAGDFDGDGNVDLIVGVVSESIFSCTDYSGAVNVLRGTNGQNRADPPGLTATGNQFWHQDSPGFPGGLPGVAEYYDGLGWAVASGLPGRP